MVGRKAGSGQRGLTLIEILVALVVLSLGLLGVAALQITSMRGTQSAYFQTQAVALARQIAESMRANPAGVSHGRYATTYMAAPDDSNCSNLGDVATQDLCLWKLALHRRLPAGTGAIKFGHGRLVVVCVRWLSGRKRSISLVDGSLCGQPAEAVSQYAFGTVL